MPETGHLPIDRPASPDSGRRSFLIADCNGILLYDLWSARRYYAVFGHDAPVATYFSPRHIPLSCIGTCVAVQLQSERISVDRENA